MKGRASIVIELVSAQLGREHGQALVEYALILALISLLAVGGLELIGTPNPGVFSRIGSAISPG
jgi:Flp pilus assembly pilin Flp